MTDKVKIEAKSNSTTTDLRLIQYQLKKLNKDSYQLFTKLSLHCKEMKLIRDYGEELKSALLTDGKKYYNRLLKFRKLVDSFTAKKSEVTQKSTWKHGTCIKDLQEMMKSIEDILTDNKSEERMIAEILLQQEVDLWQDCLNMERRITCWEKNELKTEDKTILNLQKTTSGSASLSTRLGIRNNNLPPEINDFQNFLDNHGGRTGGWTEEEHSKFLKQLKAFQIQKVQIKKLTSEHTVSAAVKQTDDDDESALQIDEAKTIKDTGEGDYMSEFHHHLANLLLTKTPEEVAKHVKWWEEYQKLEIGKRKAIQKWNENRRLNLQSKSNSETDEYEKINNDGLCLMKKEIQRMSASQLEARKAELELWRQQRGEMKRQEEEIKRQAEIEAKQAQMKMIKKKQTANQLNQLSARRKAKAEREISRQKLLEQIKLQKTVQVTRDRERLIQLTKGWEIRLSQPKTETVINQGLNLSLPSGRMIPEWRRNI
uniref:Coiled-coil domain-containing protein 112 n=1 Tax=Trichobilharzia regenti TaxID=157069 RepID=A0AA85JD16_TRIRE|nr:unnamed protein product [Trichobilharzia regenti]